MPIMIKEIPLSFVTYYVDIHYVISRFLRYIILIFIFFDVDRLNSSNTSHDSLINL